MHLQVNQVHIEDHAQKMQMFYFKMFEISKPISLHKKNVIFLFPPLPLWGTDVMFAVSPAYHKRMTMSA